MHCLRVQLAGQAAIGRFSAANASRICGLTDLVLFHGLLRILITWQSTLHHSEVRWWLEAGQGCGLGRRPTL